jgi:hypothetical protein
VLYRLRDARGAGLRGGLYDVASFESLRTSGLEDLQAERFKSRVLYGLRAAERWRFEGCSTSRPARASGRAGLGDRRANPSIRVLYGLRDARGAGLRGGLYDVAFLREPQDERGLEGSRDRFEVLHEVADDKLSVRVSERALLHGG